jgi:hypothetical protein
MKMLSVPKSVTIDTPFGHFRLQVTREARRLTVASELSLKRVRIEPGEYEAWRRFCQAVDARSEPRVLVRP